MKRIFLILLVGFYNVNAMAQGDMNPADTEVWEPVPPVVKPGKMIIERPLDAIVLFDGENLDEWVSVRHPNRSAGWIVHDGVTTVNKKAGDIRTRRVFQNYQLHLEWCVPVDIKGEGQGRGNSGLFLAAPGGSGGGYEIQILDSYNNPTYVNGQAGSVYKQFAPLVNPIRPPGEWQAYDVIWTAPEFDEGGNLKNPAFVTLFFNGVLVQNHVALKGKTVYIGEPVYQAHGPSPIQLQAHGDPSKPISFRNIWIRPL